jgi:HlyD family secretion protein
MKTFLSAIFLIAVVATGVKFYGEYRQSRSTVQFRTAIIERGNLVESVDATGTVEPEELIDVGAQVVGRIKEFGPDPRSETDPAFAGKRIDYGSTVQAGTILAVIDDSVYAAQRNQAQAALSRAQADLLQMHAKFAQAEAEWNRAQRLRNMASQSKESGKLPLAKDLPVQIRGISDADFVLAKSNYEVAKANIELGEAAVQQAQSTLDLAETNLGYTVIKSPVKGTIIDRRVNIGQTVVSSLNAPSLFLIATDLTRMEVWASVNEADIGQLKAGTPVTFTVDAFPDDLFEGTVKQVRLNASMTQNVVTYPVVITTDNSDLKLLPYLTADVSFEVNRRNGVLTVPNAALRYQPRAELVVDTETSTASSPPPEDDSLSLGTATVWIRRGAGITPVSVKTGISDGTRTEVESPDLEEGLEVVLGEMQGGQAAEQVNNPFAPRMPRSRTRS